MICDICKKNKANTYKKIEDRGEVKFYHLCPDCASKLSSSSFKNISIGEKLQVKKEQNTKKEAKICPVCFSSFNSILKSGKFGCSFCYEMFKDEFEKSILNVQDGKVHVGKRRG